MIFNSNRQWAEYLRVGGHNLMKPYPTQKNSHSDHSLFSITGYFSCQFWSGYLIHQWHRPWGERWGEMGPGRNPGPKAWFRATERWPKFWCHYISRVTSGNSHTKCSEDRNGFPFAMLKLQDVRVSNFVAKDSLAKEANQPVLVSLYNSVPKAHATKNRNVL